MWSGETSRSPRPRASHHPRNCPTARPYAARVRAFAILPAKNSRNRATADGPASTIICGRTISPAPPVAAAGSAATGTRASVVISVTTSPPPTQRPTSSSNRT